MKKFIFLLILLLIASGAALYFGWVRIPENSQAVIFSKITGYEDKAIESGSFHWRWQKLIPKTFKVHIFDLSQHTASVVSEGQLPSGNLYSSILSGNPDFAYRISFSISYTVNSSRLPELFKNGSSYAENPEEWYREKDKIIESEGNKFIASLKKSSGTASDSSEIEKKLGDHLISSLNDITVTALTLNEYNIPDMDLYNEAKRQYLNLVKNKENLIIESESRSAKDNADLERQLELLEKYGELLTKYPILLDYIKLNPDMDILKEKIGTSQE